jgi:hypothetical protein
MIEVKLDPRLTTGDGFYGGLIGGVVLSLFYVVADTITHQPMDSIYLFMASAVLGKNAMNGGWMPIALGVGMLFFLAAFGGMLYAGCARAWPDLARTPVSSFTGLLYGFIVWLIFVDIIVPTTGMQQTIDHPLWISALGIGIFYGTALCEYLSSVARSRAKRAAAVAPSSPV